MAGKFHSNNRNVEYAIMAAVFLVLWFGVVGFVDAVLIALAYFIGYMMGKKS